MDFDKLLRNAGWTGYGQFRASTRLVPVILLYYSELKHLGIEYTDLQKLQLFNGTKKSRDAMRGSTCWKAVSDKLREWIKRLNAGITEDYDGTPITFENFTHFLIEEETQWIDQLVDDRTVSQVQSNSNPNANLYDKETGEPFHRAVQSQLQPQFV